MTTLPEVVIPSKETRKEPSILGAVPFLVVNTPFLTGSELIGHLMDSALTAFEHGVSAHGGGMLNSRTGRVERRFNYTNKQGLTRLHARPTPCLLAVPIEHSASTFIQRVFLPYVC